MSIFTMRPRAREIEIVPAAEEEEERQRAEYIRLTAKHGVFRAVAAKAPTLLGALKEEGLSLYDLANVERYLDKKEGRNYWTWYPLRDKDVEWRHAVKRVTRGSYSSSGQVSNTWYQQPIPLPVLLTVDRLVERLGDEPRFYVAAIASPPDPFLAVTSTRDEKHTLYVIERWDEPGFRG